MRVIDQLMRRYTALAVRYQHVLHQDAPAPSADPTALAATCRSMVAALRGEDNPDSEAITQLLTATIQDPLPKTPDS